jgi:urease accessory protein
LSEHHQHNRQRGHGVCGRLRLEFTATDGRTRLQRCEQQTPLRVVRAFPIAEGGALAHLHNLSGGVLGGDHLELDVSLGPNAYVQLTSTGATRIYRSRPDAAPAQQHTAIRLEADARLEYLPDPVIPFAGSRYCQETRIDLATGAGLFWWDTLAPGREAYGELFDYELLANSVSIAVDGVPIALERYRLEPRLRPLASPARMDRYRTLSTFYICRAGLEAARWTALESELSELARQLSTPEQTLWGVSALPAHGLQIRGLSRAGRDIATGLMQFWQSAGLALYGRAPIAPRKVY